MSKALSPTENKTSTSKKIINKISSVMIGTIFILVIIAFFSLTVQSLGGKKPSIFGYRLYFVVTDSMEPTLKVKDVLISEAINSVDEAKDKIKTGDIVTFVAEYGIQRGMLITHRVVEDVHFDAELNKYVVLTMGDNPNATIDPPLPIENIQAIMVKDSIILTNLYKFFTSICGIIVILVIPFVFVLWCLIRKLVVAIKSTPLSSEDKEKQLIINEIKRKAVEEYKEELVKTIAEKAVNEYIEHKKEIGNE